MSIRQSEYSKNWYLKNLGKTRQCLCGNVFEFRGNSKCKSCRHKINSRYQRKKKYNLTDQELGFLERISKCEICGSMQRLCIDHCHDTGRVRGVLCHHCNTMLGMAKDSPAVLQQAIHYLENIYA